MSNQKSLEKYLIGEDKKIPNHYISLYGKTTIQEIKNEVLLKEENESSLLEYIDKNERLVKWSQIFTGNQGKKLWKSGVYNW